MKRRHLPVRRIPDWVGRELSEEEIARLVASGELVEVHVDPDWWPKQRTALQERRREYAALQESGQLVDYQAIAAKLTRLKPVKTEYRRRRRK